MKRFMCAASLILVVASANAMAEQPDNFNATHSNRGSMMMPLSDHHTGNSNLIGDKSEFLGTPYYQESSN